MPQRERSRPAPSTTDGTLTPGPSPTQRRRPVDNNQYPSEATANLSTAVRTDTATVPLTPTEDNHVLKFFIDSVAEHCDGVIDQQERYGWLDPMQEADGGAVGIRRSRCRWCDRSSPSAGFADGGWHHSADTRTGQTGSGERRGTSPTRVRSGARAVSSDVEP
jgi:hypothetical protein